MKESEYLKLILEFVNLSNGTDVWQSILAIKEERPLTLSKIEFGHKPFNDLKVKGLIDFQTKGGDRKWVRLNICDYIWLRLVDCLRTYGVSYESLLKIKLFLFKEYNVDDCLSGPVFEHTVDETFKLAQRAGQQVTKDWIRDFLKKSETQALLKDRVGNFTLMDAIVFTAYRHKFLVHFIYVDGVILPFSKDIHESQKFEEGLKLQSHIVIPMFRFITDLLENKKIPKDDLTLLFSEKGLKILDTLRKKLKTTQKITKSDADGFIWIETEESASSKISSLMNLNENQDIKIVIRNGKRKKITREARQKLE